MITVDFNVQCNIANLPPLQQTVNYAIGEGSDSDEDDKTGHEDENCDKHDDEKECETDEEMDEIANSE